MYRRNQNKCYDSRCREADGCDDSDYGMSSEEYELYRYNIPPRYDGSRFRGNNRCVDCSHHRAIEETVDEVTACECDMTNESSDNCVCAPCDTKEEENCSDSEGSENVLSKLLKNFGSEELLILSIILTIAGGEDSGELLLILVLLLLNG